MGSNPIPGTIWSIGQTVRRQSAKLAVPCSNHGLTSNMGPWCNGSIRGSNPLGQSSNLWGLAIYFKMYLHCGRVLLSSTQLAPVLTGTASRRQLQRTNLTFRKKSDIIIIENENKQVAELANAYGEQVVNIYQYRDSDKRGY